jgi:cytochrome c-type biogenesis protein
VTGAVLLWRQGHRSRAGHGPDILSSVWLAIAGAALIGGAAGLLWRPCVGPELGTILSAAPGQPFAQLIPLLLAAIAVAALTYSSRIAARAIMSMPVQIGALIPIVGLAVILLTGRYGQIIGALVKASSVS